MGLFEKGIVAKMNKPCLLIIFCVNTMCALAQQTAQFSQYVFNGLAVNPAYAGYRDVWSGNLSYRMQWTGIDGAPHTGTFSADGLLGNNKNVGLGILATSDVIGPQSTSSIYANYAYRLKLNSEDTKRLAFGLAFGTVQYKLNASKFHPNDPFDYKIPTIDESRISPDLRLGVYYYSPTFYVGASVLNLLDGAVRSAGSKLVEPVKHVYLTGGAMFRLNSSVDVKPSILFKEDFKGPTNMDLSSYLAFNRKIWLGASYRTAITLWNKKNLESGLHKSDAVAALFQLYLNDRFRVGYSFDFNTNRLSSYQNGTHEISISLRLRQKGERVLSPRFF